MHDGGVDKVFLLGLLTVGAGLLTSCVQLHERAPPLVVAVKRDGDGCRVTVNGERVTSGRLLEMGRSATRRRAIVLYVRDTPYKCIGGAVYTLQHAGLVNVDMAMWDDS